jgi:release factor glutamine methyltransferase
VVSNPPYVATAEIARLDPDVRDYDPRLALDGGTDGLDCYRVIARDAARLLAPRGRIVVEIGQGQADAVTALFAGCRLTVDMPARSDLSDIPRAVSASRNP